MTSRSVALLICGRKATRRIARQDTMRGIGNLRVFGQGFVQYRTRCALRSTDGWRFIPKSLPSSFPKMCRGRKFWWDACLSRLRAQHSPRPALILRHVGRVRTRSLASPLHRQGNGGYIRDGATLSAHGTADHHREDWKRLDRRHRRPPEIAERGLTKEAAEAKARQIADRIRRGEYNPLRRKR